MSKEDLEQFNDDALMALLPLCNAKKEDIIDYSKVWKNKLDNNKSINETEKLSLLYIYNYFFYEVFNSSIEEINKILGGNIMVTKLGKEIFEKGIIEGKKKGIIEGKRKTAKKLKKLGIEIEKIQKATGLSKKEIEEL